MAVDGKLIGGIAIGAAAAAGALLGWPIMQASNAYDTAKSTGNAVEACAQAGTVADAWGRVGLSAKHQEWAERQELDCALSRLDALAY